MRTPAAAGEIILNPKYYDKDSKAFNKTTTTPAQGIVHEIGHDLGLNHEKNKYPSEGTMGNQGSYVPTEEELKTIDNAIPPEQK